MQIYNVKEIPILKSPISLYSIREIGFLFIPKLLFPQKRSLRYTFTNFIIKKESFAPIAKDFQV